MMRGFFNMPSCESVTNSGLSSVQAPKQPFLPAPPTMMRAQPASAYALAGAPSAFGLNTNMAAFNQRMHTSQSS